MSARKTPSSPKDVPFDRGGESAASVSTPDPESWLAAIVTSSDDAIIGKRLDGTIVSWNEAASRVFGYKAEEIIGRSVLTLIPPELQSEEPMIIARLSRGERIEHYETTRLHRDGTRLTVSLSVSPIRSVTGQIVGAAKIARDISRERALLAQLESQAFELEHQLEEAQALTEELEQTNEQLQKAIEAGETALLSEQQAMDRGRRLLAVSSGLSAATTMREIAEVIFREGMTAMHANAGSLALIRGDPPTQEFETIHISGFRDEVVRHYQRFPLASGRPLSDAVLSGRPRLLGSRADWRAEYPETAHETDGLGFEAFVALPILVHGRAVAGLTFSFDQPMTFDDASRTFLATLGEQCGLALARGQAFEAERRARETSAFLAEASELLASSLDFAATLRTVAAAAVPRLGDWCAIDVVRDPESKSWPPDLERLAVVNEDPESMERGMTLATRYPTDWSADTGLAAALRHGRSTYVPVVTDAMLVAGARDPGHLEMLRALRFSSVMIVPLVARELRLGAVTLCMTESGRIYTRDDLALAENLAQRAAIAVDNSRLFREAETARHAAEVANRSKSQFLATMSHELRTPLNAIGGYTELIELGIRGPVTAQQLEDLARIRKSQRHLEGLITDVLNYAQTDGGVVQYQLETFALAETLATCEALTAPQMQARGLTFRTERCGPELRVVADREKVRQIILNLLTNSIKFTNAGGSVALACDTDQAAVYVHVQDTGRGIAPDQLERIFEPFVQLDAPLTRTEGGVGLGLAISRELARGMAGELTVESALGRGSTFTLALPIAG